MWTVKSGYISFAIIFVTSSNCIWSMKGLNIFWRKKKEVRGGCVKEIGRYGENEKERNLFNYSACFQVSEGHSWTAILESTLRLLLFTLDSITVSFLQLLSHFREEVGWIQQPTFINQIIPPWDQHPPNPSGQPHYAFTNWAHWPTLNTHLLLPWSQPIAKWTQSIKNLMDVCYTLSTVLSTQQIVNEYESWESGTCS